MNTETFKPEDQHLLSYQQPEDEALLSRLSSDAYKSVLERRAQRKAAEEQASEYQKSVLQLTPVEQKAEQVRLHAEWAKNQRQRRREALLQQIADAEIELAAQDAQAA